MTNHQFLRAETGPLHDRVDAAFGTFSLGSRDEYAAFLRAHGAALAAVEPVLAAREGLPAWRPRLPALRADLAALGEPMPEPLTLHLPADDAAALGMLYVLEGSRLGGAMLARSVGEGLPAAYLGSKHEAGGWRGFLAALDAAGDGTEAWRAQLLTGAEVAFGLFERAAVSK